MSLVTLPTSLSGEIREIDIGDENALADRRLVRSGRNVQEIFKNCWLSTADPGIYRFENGKLDPDQLLQGDSLTLLVELRIESHGSRYEFDVNCPRRGCGLLIPWELDLREYLEINAKKLPDESRIILTEKDGIFESVFPKCGRAYKFKLLRGKDERRFPVIRRKDAKRLSSTLVDLSLLSVEGITNKRAFLMLDKYPKDAEERPTLSSSDANWFRRHSDEVNCGLETSFEVECADCGEVKVELPFLDEFLLPNIVPQ